jgi:hypothetical protein
MPAGTMRPLTSLRQHEIAEAGHRILNPFTEEKLMLLGEVCRAGSGTRILDLCCGKGELQWWTVHEWLAEHPDDPEGMRAYLEESRTSYLTWQRRYMGWGGTWAGASSS